ncbi:ribonuclease H-like domain-containing protein [Tanacetum coccineum]
MTDAKEMWDAIKSRFGGNDESKKMQKYILKQQFEGFSVSNTEGLHKGYDRFQSLLSQLEIHGAGVSTEDANQKFLRSLPSAWSQVSLIMRTKPGVDSLSFDDLYNNLRVFESDIKGSTASSSSPQNVAFVSENTSSTNDVSTAYCVPNLSGQNSKYEQTSSYSLLANQSSCPQLDHEDLEQIDEYDLEEMDLKWQVAMISMRMKKFYKKTGRKLQFDAKEPVGFDKTKVECYNCHKTGHFARECRIKGTQDNRRRDAWNSGNKDGSRTGQKEDSKALVTIDGEGVDWTNHSEDEDYALMACNSSDSDTEFWAWLGDHRYDGILSYENEVLQSVFMNKESELEKQPLYDRPEIEMSEPVVNESNIECQPKVWSDAPIIEEYESDSEDEYVSTPRKEQETPSFANQQVKTPRETIKNQFTHSQKPKVDKTELGKKVYVNNGWNNVQRVNKQNQFVPSAVLTRTGKIPVSTAIASSTKNFSTARQSFNRQTTLTSTAMKVNTVKPIVNRVRPANVSQKTHSPYSRPFKKTTVLRTNFSKQKVNTAKVNAVSTVGGKRETAVKPSAGCNWRPQRYNWHNDSPHRALKNKRIVDSGCSRHMTGNKAYLAEFQDFNGGPVAFEVVKYITGTSLKLPDENQVLLKIPRQNNMYSFNLENTVPSGGLACLIANATTNESNKWHRRLGHVNFKNLNKLVEGNLVRGFPSKIFQNDHTCVACQKGKQHKQHKSSCKAKTVSSISHSLQLLHMDLFGPTSVRSLNNKTYCLVITDDFSRSENQANLNAGQQEANQNAETENLVIQEGAAKTSSTNIFSTVSTPAKASSTNLVNTVSIPVSTASPHEGLSLSDPTNPEEDDSEIPPLEDIYQNSTDGIFTTSSYGMNEDKACCINIPEEFDFANVKTASTPIETQKPLVKDEEASDVDVHLYRSMIGSLMYLTASRADILFAVCACSRFQVTPKSSHLSVVKRIFRYLKGKPKLGLWYPRVSSFDLESYSDSDYAGANLDRKSTTGGCQFLGRRLISWQCKKQTIVATSTTEAEYVAAASCCGQVLWIQNQIGLIEFRESLRRVTDGTEALLIPTLFILWLDKVSTDSAKLVPLGKVCTAIETLKKNTAKGTNFHSSCSSLHITAKVAGKSVSISEASIRSDLLFDDANGIDSLPNQAIFDAIQLMGYEGDLTYKQLANVPVPLDHFPVNTLTSKVFSFMVKKGKHFSGKITPLFASMLVQPTEDEGAPSERPSAAQPTPSPAHTSEVPFEPHTDSSHAHTSEVPIEQQNDPSPRPSPSTIIPDSIPETSGGNLGGHSSSDKSLSGMRIKEKVSTDRPIVSTDGSKVSTDRQIEGIDEQIEGTDEQRKGTEEQIESTDEQRKGTEDHTEEGSATQATQTPTSTIFGDDETIAKVLLNMSQAKAVSREKEKGVELKDIEETNRPRPTSTRSLLTLKPLPKIDPRNKGNKKNLKTRMNLEIESDGIP